MTIQPSAISAFSRYYTGTTQLNPAIVAGPEQFRKEEEYRNYFDFPVVIIDSNNHRTVYKPLPANFKVNKNFTIIRKYTWNNNRVEFNVDGLYYDNTKYVYDGDKSSGDYTDCFYNMVTDAFNQCPSAEHQCGQVEINLTESTFRKYNGAVFIKELGIVIATVDLADQIINPISTEAQISRAVNETPMGFVFQIFANDPSGVEYNTRYVNINGQVYKVPVQSDPNITAGVYVSRGEPPVGVEHTANDLLLERYDFDVADKVLNLYPTPQAAKDHFGLLSADKEQQLKELDYKLKEQALVNKAKLEQMQLDFAKEKQDIELEYKRQINEYKTIIEELKVSSDLRAAKLKQQADEFEARSMQRKDSYESASYARKDWSEYVKWIPAVAVGVVTAVAACFALFF